jgi:hypothetical protein
MSDCYHFEKYTFNEGLLHNCIDATYILHLEGNGRLVSIMEQLKKYKPSKIVYILHNKGFKKCKKAEHIKSPPRDLVDANIQIFNHSKSQNYENILVLEDDFFFNDKIKSKSVQDNVTKFIKSKSGEPFLYLLGCVPWFSIPQMDGYTYYSTMCTGTHACIFSKSYREKLMESNLERDWDLINLSGYMYFEPLCYQLFPETENRKHWGEDNETFTEGAKIIIFLFILLGIDKNAEPGYSYFYLFSKTIFWIVVFIVLMIGFYLSKKIKFKRV